MVRRDTRTVGHAAEQQAFDYLRRHGLRPVARNYHCRLGEIDLIMRDGDCLVFVEVRYRSPNSYASAAMTVDGMKQVKLSRTAELFLTSRPDFTASTVRFDVVGIDRKRDGRTQVEWIRDAFRP